MIRYAQEIDRPTLMDLWKRCFSDTDEFIRFYFNRVYREKETLVMNEGETLAASLQVIPYNLKIGSNIHLAGYISGAMTHPDHRRQGRMEQLLLFAFEEMKKKDYTITFLIPQEEWLFGFYKKYGYKNAFPIHQPVVFEPNITLKNTDLTEIIGYSNADNINPDSLYSVYHAFLSRKENVVLKTRQQFSSILEDLFLDKGTVFVGDRGIAFTLPGKDEVSVKELFFENEEVRHQFLTAIACYYSGKRVVVLNSDTIHPPHYSGMIRVLNTTHPLPKDIYMSMMLD